MRVQSIAHILYLSLLTVGLSASNQSTPEAPPVKMRSFSSQPLVAISLPAAPQAIPSALASPPGLNMKLLVIDGNTSEISYLALTAFLGQIGVPFDVIVLSNITPDASGNRLYGLALTDPSSGYGNYQGVLLTNSTLGGLLSTSDWAKLDTYCTQFGVRMVSYYTLPDARWGLVAGDSGANYLSANPLEVTLTTAGAAVFSYLNSANPIPVAGNAVSGIYAYQATPTAATGEITTPLLTAGPYTLGVIHKTAAGEQTMALTFDNYPALLHSLAFNYGVINWVTQGVFLGSRQIYLSNQIDDFLIGDRLYAPALAQCPDDPTCPTQFASAFDLQALGNWQANVRLNPLFESHLDTFAYVGIGSTWYPPDDPLFAAITSFNSQFDWVSQTWSHTNPDCYSITNGVCVPATLSQSLYEIRQNKAAAATLGITIDPTGLVPPFNAGLGNHDFLTAAFEEGVDEIVYAGAPQSPNTGIVNSFVTSILEVPRFYTNLFDDVSTPATGAYGSWPDEYNAQYGPSGTTPVFSQIQTYSQILDDESDNVLLLNMLSGQLSPLGFYICNIYAYDGTHSLYSDLMDAAMTKYMSSFNLPVVALSMKDMRPLLTNRASYNNSGVTGVYTPGVSVVLSTVNAATIPVTGACSQPTCPTYGGQIQDSVAMPANSTITLSLNSGGAQ